MAPFKTTFSLLVFAAAITGCAKDSASNDNAARPKAPPPPSTGTESVAKKYLCKAASDRQALGPSFDLEVSADGETAFVRAGAEAVPYQQQVSGIDSSSDFLVFSSETATPAEISINGWMVQSDEAEEGRVVAGRDPYVCKRLD